MKNTHDIFGWNQIGKMQNFVLQGYLENSLWRETKLVFLEKPKSKVEKAEQLNKWVDQYNQIDVKINQKRREMREVEKTHKEIKELKEKKDNEIDSIKKEAIQTKIDNILKQSKSDHSWAYTAGNFVGEVFIWVPTKIVQAVGGVAAGIGEGVGVNSVLGKLKNKAQEWYQKGKAGTDLTMASAGLSAPDFNMDEFLNKLQKNAKIEAMKEIILHAKNQNPPVQITFKDGQFKFPEGDIKELHTSTDSEQEIIIKAYAELLQETPNFDGAESITSLINVLTDLSTGNIADVSLEEIKKRLNEYNSAEIDIDKLDDLKINLNQAQQDLIKKGNELTKLQTELQDKQSELAEAELIRQKYPDLLQGINANLKDIDTKISEIQNKINYLQTTDAERQINADMREKEQNYVVSRDNVILDVTHDIREGIEVESFQEAITKYNDVNDIFFPTKVLKGTGRFLKWLVVDDLNDKKSQELYIRSITRQLIEIQPVPKSNQEPDNVFQESLKNYWNFLQKLGFDEFKQNEALWNIANSRQEYLALVTYRPNAFIKETPEIQGLRRDITVLNLKKEQETQKYEAYTLKKESVGSLTTKFKSLQNKTAEAQTDYDAQSKVFETQTQEFTEQQNIMLADANLKKLYGSNLGQMILTGKITEAEWRENLLPHVQENQTERNETKKALGKLISEDLKYKPSLSENVMDAIEDLPPIAKIAGVIMAILMIKNNPNFGKILWGLGLAGIVGEIATRASTDGETGIIDFIQEKAKSLTGDAQDQLAQMESITYRNTLLKILEKDPSKAKDVMVLSFVAEDKVTSLMNNVDKKPDGTLFIKEDYYSELTSREGGKLWQYFKKHDISKTDFENAIKMYFVEISPNGQAGSGYDFIQGKLNDDPTWKGYTMIDVAFNSIQPELQNAEALTPEQKQANIEYNENLKLNELKNKFNNIGLNSIELSRNADKKIEGKLAWYKVIDIENKEGELTFKVEGLDSNLDVTNTQILEDAIAKVTLKKISVLLPENANIGFDGKNGYFGLGENLIFKVNPENTKLEDVYFVRDGKYFIINWLQISWNWDSISGTIGLGGQQLILSINAQWKYEIKNQQNNKVEGTQLDVMLASAPAVEKKLSLDEIKAKVNKTKEEIFKAVDDIHLAFSTMGKTIADKEIKATVLQKLWDLNNHINALPKVQQIKELKNLEIFQDTVVSIILNQERESSSGRLFSGNLRDIVEAIKSLDIQTISNQSLTLNNFTGYVNLVANSIDVEGMDDSITKNEWVWIKEEIRKGVIDKINDLDQNDSDFWKYLFYLTNQFDLFVWEAYKNKGNERKPSLSDKLVTMNEAKIITQKIKALPDFNKWKFDMSKGLEEKK